MNSKEAKAKRPSMGRSRKGCMKGKGGPENALCTYKGVRQRTWGKWVAEIREPTGGTRIWLGTFNTSLDAAKAYDQAALRLYGPSADLNLPSSTCHMPTPINALLSTGTTSIQQEDSMCNQEVLGSSTVSTPQSGSLTLTDHHSMVANTESFGRGVDNMNGFWESSSSSGLIGGGQSVYYPDFTAENDNWGIDYDAGFQAGGLVGGESICRDGFQDPWGF